MSFRMKSLLLPAFAFVIAMPAFSQVTAVQGTVKDENGKPVVGATVIFERTDIKGHYEVKTKKKGDYGYYGLPMGTFNISVSVDGAIKDTAKNFRTSPGDPKELNFDLKATAQQQQQLKAAMDSGAPISKELERGMTKEQKEAFDKNVKANVALKEKQKQLNDSFATGKAALDAKNYDAAIEALTKGAEVDPKQGAIWGALAEAYIGKAGTTPAEASANYDKAFDAFKKAIEISPEDAGLYNNYALALAKDKKIDDAKTNLAKAVQLDPPGAGKYYYNLGALLVNSGQNTAAEEEFKHAIDADPTYADAQYQYGMALSAKANVDPKTGKVTPAPGTTEALQKYLELKPDGANAQSAKEMIAALGGTVSTSFGPQKGAAKPTPATNKKK